MAHLSAFVNVNKPPGPPTRVLSNVLLALLRHKIAVGHIGTLDAAAQGVVPMALGRACLLIPYLSRHDKRYTARIKLGVSHSTGDSSGVIEAVAPLDAKVDRGGLQALLSKLIDGKTEKGPLTFLQRPHHVSAIWVNGRRAYKVARSAHREACPDTAAEAVAKLTQDIKPKEVTLYSAKTQPSSLNGLPSLCCGSTGPVEEGSLSSAPFCSFPEVEADLHVSSGFFVRSFVRDLGAELASALSTGNSTGNSPDATPDGAPPPFPATLADLTRTSCGVFPLSTAHPMYSLSWRALPSMVTPMDQPFAEEGLPAAIMLGPPAVPFNDDDTQPKPKPKPSTKPSRPVPFTARKYDFSLMPPLDRAYPDPTAMLHQTVRWSHEDPSPSSPAPTRPLGPGDAIVSAVKIWTYSSKWPVAAALMTPTTSEGGEKSDSSIADAVANGAPFRVYMMVGAASEDLKQSLFSVFPPVSAHSEQLKDELLSSLPEDKRQATRMVFLGLGRAVPQSQLPRTTKQGVAVTGHGDGSRLFYIQRLVSVMNIDEDEKTIRKAIVAPLAATTTTAE